MSIAPVVSALILALLAGYMFLRLRIVPDLLTMGAAARGSLAILTDHAADDDVKERAAREAAFAVAGGLVRVLLKLAAIAVIGTAFVLLCDVIGLSGRTRVLETLLSAWFLVALTLAGTGLWLAARRSR